MRLLFFTSLSIFLLFLSIACSLGPREAGASTLASSTDTTLHHLDPKVPVLPLAEGFDFPLGPPDGKGYYNAQPFGSNLHLGDDWNGVGGGNTDLGDTIYSIGLGKIVFSEDIGGGWGKVVRVVHRTDSTSEKAQVEALYAHMDTVWVQAGQILQRGEALGTVGNADGIYYAHLHLEIRSTPGMPIGGGYSHETKGYLNPTAFIKKNRPNSD